MNNLLTRVKCMEYDQKIAFHDFKRTVVGKQPAAIVICTEGGVMPGAQNADS